MNNRPNAPYKTIFTISLFGKTLQHTREGGGFVLLMLGVGFGAINTGNNLLYLILAMCCSFIAVSGILSEWTLRKIEVTGQLPPSFYANGSVALNLKISNKKKKMGSYALRFFFVENAVNLEQDINLFYLPPQSTHTKSVFLKASQRGPLEIDHCRIATSFPFGFFIKSQEIPLHLTALVYPEIKEIPLPRLGDLEKTEGISISTEGELLSIREFREGDSLAQIHWKSSAKTGDLRVKVFCEEKTQTFKIALNLNDPVTGLDLAGPALEHAISTAASLTYGLIKQGNRVALSVEDFETVYENTPAHLQKIMEYLACVGHS
ncbi:MAG: hypothetical protein COV66_14125 [Nitrospinae bacterium CG11_big_fil_rev_8_21_14_0_20_45_15]|nr:MAG: hypothetical protein COV66_14125 [Nitrospinae bacterium CG11_big_fil_rev_8_21_14_0_20_45_15]